MTDTYTGSTSSLYVYVQHSFGLCNNSIRIGDDPPVSEENLITVYKHLSLNVFDNAAYNYARTVCCLRLISIVKVLVCVFIYFDKSALA